MRFFALSLMATASVKNLAASWVAALMVQVVEADSTRDRASEGRPPRRAPLYGQGLVVSGLQHESHRKPVEGLDIIGIMCHQLSVRASAHRRSPLASSTSASAAEIGQPVVTTARTAVQTSTTSPPYDILIGPSVSNHCVLPA